MQVTDNRKVVRVAAVQMHSLLGQVDSNLQHATDLVEQAARDGAVLVLLPELAACGYSLSRAIWDVAEPREGKTVAWLRETARRFSIYLGTGFVEAEGDDFYDSYALGAPDGHLVGVVRKTMAETAFFRCAMGSHIVTTGLGTLGIGICADNQFAPMVRRMQAASVDLMLMPHAVPGAFKTGGAVSKADITRAIANMRDLAPLYAHLLGVPALVANHVGPRGPERWAGIVGLLMNPAQFRFLGQSNIADSDATIRAQLDGEAEGVAIAEVTLDPVRKGRRAPEAYGRYGGGWLFRGASGDLPRDVLIGIDALMGLVRYRLSAQRRRKARAVAMAERATPVRP